ncbi:MAG: GNAT family N-acetyltransferase [Lachnospiraceae bacterium]|nr:GNAT family N-acetyltransferase [Lachnospiraceae bacterium]
MDGNLLPEIGYHIHKKYWRKGFGSEAARAVRDWAFENTKYNRLYFYMKYTNVGSYSTAIANGVKKVIFVGHGMIFRCLTYIEKMSPAEIIECTYQKGQAECEYLFT